jgi:hypothetical protein
MQTAEEFMQSYFAERTQLLREHLLEIEESLGAVFSESYLHERNVQRDRDSRLENSEPPFVLSIVSNGFLAEVVSSEPDVGKRKQCRYYLTLAESGWLIEKIFEECWMCKDYEGKYEHCCENCWTPVDYCL